MYFSHDFLIQKEEYFLHNLNSKTKKDKINTHTHHYTYICSWICFWYTEIILLKFKIKFTPPKKKEKMNIHLYAADLSLPA